MKAAKNGSCCDGAETLDHSMEWRIFVQRAMNAAFIIVGGELDEDPTQVCLPEHDQVVDALPSDCADQSFRKAVVLSENPIRLGSRILKMDGGRFLLKQRGFRGSTIEIAGRYKGGRVVSYLATVD
jgi:hypothetical protein